MSSGVVYCIVDPDRRAWHAGNGKANHTQIGLELDPNASQRAGTMATAAALIADLRSVYGDLPLYPHKHWTSTACPGNYDLKALDRLARGKAPAPAPSKPAPAVKPDGSLTVDGRFGHATVRDLQEWLNREHDAGLEVDGKAGRATWRALEDRARRP